MGTTFYFEWEVQLISMIQRHLNPFMVLLLSLISEFGEEIVIVLFAGALYWSFHKKLGKYLILNVLTTLAFSTMVKNLFSRRRPYFDSDEIECLKVVDDEFAVDDVYGQGFSFPSAHTSNVTALFSSLYLYTKKKGLLILAVVMIALVGFSRFALGVHYPTDVLFGFTTGLLIVFLLSKLYGKVEKKKLYLAIGIISLSGFFFCRSSDYYSAAGLLSGFLAGDLYEERYVNFKDTKDLLAAFIRTAGGIIVLVGVSALIKLPFPKEFLESEVFPAFFIRFFRYFLATFLAVGPYPSLFRYLKDR